MPTSASTREQSALRLSLVISLAIAIVAVGWGLIANSQIILFDGVFTLLGTALTGLSLVAARIAEREPSKRFPFGLEAVVPLAVGMQGLALLGTIGYASLEAVRTILDGGSEVAATAVAAYGATTAVASLLFWLWLRKVDRSSDLLQAEARGWLAGVVLSTVVLAGALLALGLRAAGLRAVEPFVDPSLVIVACLLLIPLPIGMLRSMFRELLEGAPEQAILVPVEAAVAQVRARHDLPEPILRVGKLGRKLYVEADFVVGDGWDVVAEDRIRRDVRDGLAHLPYDVWLNVELTMDPDLLL